MTALAISSTLVISNTGIEINELFLEVRLASRLKFGTHNPGMLPAWTESIGRHLAVIHSMVSINFSGNIRKNDEIAMEIDLPEKYPFAPRCILCEGRVDFVSPLMDDSIRLGMIVDRMHFRPARVGVVEPLASKTGAREVRSRERVM